MAGNISLSPDRGWFEPAKTLAFGGIGDNYAAIDTVISYPTRVIMIFNKTNKDLWISIDGVNDYWPINAGYGLVLDDATNGMSLPAGTMFYVKNYAAGDPPTSGSIIVSIGYKK